MKAQELLEFSMSEANDDIDHIVQSKMPLIEDLTHEITVVRYLVHCCLNFPLHQFPKNKRKKLVRMMVEVITPIVNNLELE